MINIDNNKQNDYFSLLTTEKAAILQNEITNIWKRIGWEEDTKSFKKGLSDEEINKIVCLSKFTATLNVPPINSNIDDLKNFATKSLQQAEYIMKRIDENFESACNYAEWDLYGNETTQAIKNYPALSTDQVFEIAKIAAHRSQYLAEHIHKWEIKDQNQLFEIAKILAEKFAYNVSENLNNFKGLSSQQKYEIAKIAAKNSGTGVTIFLKNFEITDNNKLFEIARIAASNENIAVAGYIQNYNFQDPAQLLEIARTIVKNTGYNLSKNLSKFQIQAEDDRYEIAKKVVLYDDQTAEFIQNYRIQNPEKLFEIAKIAASKGNICEFIQNFQGLSQEQFFQLAIISAKGSSISKHIHKYGLNDVQRLEIAKIAAGGFYPQYLSEFIQNYSIKEYDQLVEIAKIAANTEADGISQHIEKYGFKDLDLLFEIAKIALNGKKPYGLSKYLLNYHIQDPLRIEELAFLAAQKDLSLASNIQKFNIKDQKKRIEIAHFFVQISPSNILHNFENFEIYDQTELVKIAKTLAANYIYTSSSIKKFEIKDQNDRFEIAKIAASNSQSFSGNLEDYQITDQRMLVELAKISIQTCFSDTGLFFKKYGIQDVKQRFEILKLGFEKHSGKIFSISSFDLSDEYLFEIAKIDFQKRGIYIFTDLFAFEFKDPKYSFEMAKIAISSNKCLESFALLSYFKLPLRYQLELFLLASVKIPHEMVKLIEILSKNVSLKFNEEEISKFRGLQIMLKPETDLRNDEIAFLDPFIKIKDKEFSNNARIKLNAWMGYLLLHFQYSTKDKISLEQFLKDSKFTSFFAALTKLHHPERRYQLTGIFLRHFYNNSTNFFQIFENLKKINSLGNKDNPIFRFLLATLMDESDLKEFENGPGILSNWNIVFSTLALSTYKDANAQMTVINSLCSLVDLSELNIQKKQQLIFSLFGLGKEIKDKRSRTKLINRNLRFMESILQGNNSQLLLPFISLKPKSEMLKTDSLLLCIQTIFYNIVGKINVTNFSDKFERTFLKARQPHAYFSYASKLQSLQDAEKSILKPFIQKIYFEILEGRFQENRYKENEHLSKLFSWKADLKELWTKNIRKVNHNNNFESDEKSRNEDGESVQKRLKMDQIDPSCMGWSVEETDDWEDLLLMGTEVVGSCQSINGDPRYSKCLLNYLVDGKNRIAILKDSEGRIRARMVLRLLSDSVTKQPVLFREKIYKTEGISNYALKALFDLINFKARILGIPLVRSKEDREPELLSKRYPHDTESLNGITRYEYVDANSLRITSGKFTIPAKEMIVL